MRAATARRSRRFKKLSVTRSTRMVDRRTGRKVVVRTRRMLSNPATSWRELGFITGGVVLGMVAADMVGRWVVTRKPAGGNHDFYADDAARRIAAAPTGERVMAQGAVGIAALALSSRMKNMPGNLLFGMAIGAFALTGLQILNAKVMPMIYGGVVNGDEMNLGNRLFPWEQEKQQAQLLVEFAETSKPDSIAQQGKNGKLPAPYAIYATSTTTTPPATDSALKAPGTQGLPAETRARENLNRGSAGTGKPGKVGGCGGGCNKMCSCPACLDAWQNGFVAPHSPAYRNGGEGGTASGTWGEGDGSGGAGQRYAGDIPDANGNVTEIGRNSPETRGGGANDPNSGIRRSESGPELVIDNTGVFAAPESRLVIADTISGPPALPPAPTVRMLPAAPTFASDFLTLGQEDNRAFTPAW